MLTNLEKDLIAFFLQWPELKYEENHGPAVIQCETLVASQFDCYQVVSMEAFLSLGYMRVASKLYPKRWRLQHEGRAKRVVLDPAYGLQLQQKEDSLTLAKFYGGPFCNLLSKEISMVFVPILQVYYPMTEYDHWWCAAFSLQDKHIWLIDPLVPDPMREHRHLFEYQDNIEEARVDVVLDDVFSDVNQRKSSIEELVNSSKKQNKEAPTKKGLLLPPKKGLL